MDGRELKRRFGRRVQHLREGKGLSQEQLAALVGRSVDTIGNIERGVNATRIETAAQIAAQLGVRLTELFDLEDGGDDRERHEALASVRKLLVDLDLETIADLRALLKAGLKLAAR